MEEFRLGVQKCRKTIQSTVVEFNVDGAEELLESMRQDCERLSCLTNVEQVTKKDPARLLAYLCLRCERFGDSLLNFPGEFNPIPKLIMGGLKRPRKLFSKHLLPNPKLG